MKAQESYLGFWDFDHDTGQWTRDNFYYNIRRRVSFMPESSACVSFMPRSSAWRREGRWRGEAVFVHLCRRRKRSGHCPSSQKKKRSLSIFAEEEAVIVHIPERRRSGHCPSSQNRFCPSMYAWACFTHPHKYSTPCFPVSFLLKEGKPLWTSALRLHPTSRRITHTASILRGL